MYRGIAGCVVWYNPIEADAIQNINSYISELDCLYIIDNSEQKIETSFLLKLEKYVKVRYIALGENRGIAAALNIGADEAWSAGYKWLLTMDQDSSLTSIAVKEMYTFIKSHPDLNMGILAALPTCSIDRIKKNMVWQYVETAFTSGNLVNLKAFKKVGGWNEDLFIDGVDYDFDFRIQLAGYVLVQYNHIIFPHKLGNVKEYRLFGRKLFASTHHNYIRRYYIVRNRLYLCKKYGNIFRNFAKEERLANIKEFFKILFVEKDKWRKLRSFWLGFYDFRHNKLGQYSW